VIVHRSGAQNANADALSRIRSVSKVQDQTGVPDESKRRAILHEFYDSPIWGHRG